MTPGSALFVGPGGLVTQSNPFFFFDNTNHRLGIGTSAPRADLEIRNGVGTPTLYLASSLTQFVSIQGGNGLNVAATNWQYIFTDFNDAAGQNVQLITWNTDSTTLTSNAILTAMTENVGSGDPYFRCLLHTPGTGWSFGLDNSDSDSWVLSRGLTLGTNNRFKVDTTGNVYFPIYTTGSVPFIGAGGQVTENNASFFWDNTNHFLGLGVTPTHPFHIRQTNAGVNYDMFWDWQNTSPSIVGPLHIQRSTTGVAVGIAFWSTSSSAPWFLGLDATSTDFVLAADNVAGHDMIRSAAGTGCWAFSYGGLLASTNTARIACQSDANDQAAIRQLLRLIVTAGGSPVTQPFLMECGGISPTLILTNTDSAQSWTQGIDRTDSNKYKFSASGTLGTSDALNLTTGGSALFADGAVGTPAISFKSGTSTGFYWSAIARFAVGGTLTYSFGSTQFFMHSDSAEIDMGASSDVKLVRDGAAIFALKNSTTAQTARIYGTTTGPKYLSLSHDGTNGIVDVAASSGHLTIGGNATNITASSVIVTANGAVGGPSYAFAADATSGFYFSTIIRVAVAGTLTYSFGSTQFFNASDSGQYVLGASSDTAFKRVSGSAIVTTTAGQIAVATAAKAAGDTTGYFCIPSTAGAPTGTPSPLPTGQIPLQYDSTNNKLYAYNGGWKKAQTSGVDVVFA
jgi:hypothetical protein